MGWFILFSLKYKPRRQAGPSVSRCAEAQHPFLFISYVAWADTDNCSERSGKRATGTVAVYVGDLIDCLFRPFQYLAGFEHVPVQRIIPWCLANMRFEFRGKRRPRHSCDTSEIGEAVFPSVGFMDRRYRQNDPFVAHPGIKTDFAAFVFEVDAQDGREQCLRKVLGDCPAAHLS